MGRSEPSAAGRLSSRPFGGSLHSRQAVELARLSFNRAALVALALALAGSASCRSSSNPQAEADRIRATERERLRALVAADIEVARKLHTDDFQLVHPSGGSLSKEQYLGGVASGEIDYLVWEPELIEVRLYGRAALIRYQSRLEIVVRGQKVSLRRYWRPDSYEKRGGRWQVVWSQATEAADHGVAADSPPSLSLGPLAALARLAAERPAVGPSQQQPEKPCLGEAQSSTQAHVRFGSNALPPVGGQVPT